ncbi:ABC transporter substrate-binding protein [Ensifer sp. ENS11]|nr:ABC transporter substrate-binding protein [Ensifer sp. ENS11]
MMLKTLFMSSALIAATATTAAAQQLSVVCSSEQDHCDLVANEFRAASGADISLIRKSTGETLAQIRAESGNPKIDVWFAGTGDPHMIAAEENLTEASGADTTNLLGWAKNMAEITDGKAIGVYAGALGIGYNAELLKEKGLKAPACWKDLADPAYRGEIQVSNPNSSGTAYTEIATLVQLFGEDEAFRLLAEIGKNVNQYTKSGSAPVKAAARGESVFAIGFMANMVQQKNSGFPLEIVAPCEGTGYEVGAVSMVKGTKNTATAKRFIDFVLSPDGQKLGAQAQSYQTPSNLNTPVPPEVGNLSSVKLIDYDFATYGSSKTREKLLARWDAEVKSAGGAIEQ